MPHFQCPEKLERLVTVPKRFKIIIGGRGGAKSQTVGDINLMGSQMQGLKVAYFREFQNSIEDSVKSLLENEIDRLELHGFRSTDTEISNSSGGLFKFKGLARNLNSVQSMHGFDRFIIEEAQFLSQESIKVLTPTLRESGSELWFLANPQSSADPFSQRFLAPFQRYIDRDGYYEDDLHMVIVVNYYDNPFFPDELDQERRFDKEHLSDAEYAHKWLGKYNDTVPGSIIPVEWFNAAIDAHIKLGIEPRGAVIVSHDPSDLGPDPKGLCVRHGSVVLEVLEKDDGDVNEGADWATEIAISRDADCFRWDCDGLGVSLKRQIVTAMEGKRIDLDMFKGSEGVDRPDEIYLPDNRIDRTNAKTNKQTFKNKRAQYYWALRDRFMATYNAVKKGIYTDPEQIISLSSQIEIIDRLRSEVCRIPKKPNANGLIQIMSKEDMKRLKPPIPSPNLADSLMMSMPGHVRTYQTRAQARPVVKKSAAGWT